MQILYLIPYFKLACYCENILLKYLSLLVSVFNLSPIILRKKKLIKKTSVKQGNFDWRGNFDQSGSFVKLAPVLIQDECRFVASALMEINDWCLGLRIYMYLRPCLHRSNLKTSYKLGISRKNRPFFKTVLTYWMVPYW